MPIAVIQNATLPSQRVLICTLETVVEEVATNQLASPSIIIIGEVVTLNRAAAIAASANAPNELQRAVGAF
jgi:uroporphyrin-III C-methyltransferase